MYGNKVLGVMNGVIDIHGKPRSKTFTLLANSANAGDSLITVMDTVDWQVGELIVIASSDFDMNQAETRYITAVSEDQMTLTLD